MPKKTRPIIVLTTEELDTLDDATLTELVADEERLHQALEEPSAIRSDGQRYLGTSPKYRLRLAMKRLPDNGPWKNP